MAGLTRKELVPKLDRMRNSLKNDRDIWLQDCKEIARLFYPKQLQSLNEEQHPQNEKKTRLNNTAMSSMPIIALSQMAAGLQSGLVTPGRPWFKRGLTDLELEKSSRVREWLDEVTKIELEILARTNFYDNIFLLFKSAGSFGSGCMFVLPDEDKHVRFKTLEVGTYYMAENKAGAIDMIFREMNMTARMIWEEFEEANGEISDAVMVSYNDVADRDKTRFIVVNAVLPNPDPSITGLPWKFLDVYYLKDAKSDPEQFLRLSGFEEKPFGAPRWEPMGVYGTSPAIDVFPDARQLQVMEKEILHAIALQVNPPMIGDDELDIRPGALNPNALTGGNDQVRPVLTVVPDIKGTLLKTQELKEAINKGLFINLFQSILSAPDVRRTATEVQARREEGLFALGTVVERFTTEGLNPMLDRTFRILFEKGLFPEPPEELQGQELKVEYTSILSQAQKAGALNSIERFLGFIQVAAQTHPEIVDSFNFDKAADEVGQTIPAELLNDQKKREEIREERRQEQLLRDQAEAAAQGADNLNKIADADSKGSEVVNQALR